MNSLELRLEHRPAHIKRIQELHDQGRVLAAGPHPAVDAEDPGVAGFTGSLLVVKFPNLKAAEEWAAEDPFLKNGIYASSVVKPFKKVLP